MVGFVGIVAVELIEIIIFIFTFVRVLFFMHYMRGTLSGCTRFFVFPSRDFSGFIAASSG